MPLYIRLDIYKDGRVWAWVSRDAGVFAEPAKIGGSSVPVTLRKLAAAYAEGKKV